MLQKFMNKMFVCKFIDLFNFKTRSKRDLTKHYDKQKQRESNPDAQP